MREIVTKTMDPRDLKLGMHVVNCDRPWIETDFMIQGFVIQHQDEIDAFIRQCNYVSVEGVVMENYVKPLSKSGSISSSKKQSKPITTFPEGTFDITPNFQPAKPINSLTNSHTNSLTGIQKPPSFIQKVNYINKIDFQNEMPTAKENYESAKASAKAIMEDIRFGRSLDINHAREAVDDIVDSLLRNSEALVWLTKIKETDERSADHSLNVCILAIGFARFLGHMESDIRKIGLCGLLHDVGNSRMPPSILGNCDKYTDEEIRILKRHPEIGRSLLTSLPGSELCAVDVAYSHHEREDGKGYPRGLESHQIPYFAKIISLADTYNSVTSANGFNACRASMNALDVIYKNRDSQFNSELALEFIKFIGIFPPGSIVEMSNGEVGIVISENKKSKLLPTLLMVKDRNKTWVKQHIIDLSKHPLDEYEKTYKIGHEVINGTYGVDIQEYSKRGLVLH